jgi:hypothetical protein
VSRCLLCHCSNNPASMPFRYYHTAAAHVSRHNDSALGLEDYHCGLLRLPRCSARCAVVVSPSRTPARSRSLGNDRRPDSSDIALSGKFWEEGRKLLW